jgi:predicted GIY-YIG superfamily endonuclease
MPSKKKKKETAITVFDPNQPITVYELLRPDRANKPVYIGRTCDLDRRTGEHKASTCPLVRLLRELTDISIRDNIRPVPELPYGVPASRAVEMEAYFIMQRDTVYHATRNPAGCNTNNGAHMDQLTPERYREIEAELASGFEWPAESGMKNDVPEEVAMARGKEAVVEEIVATVAEEGESTALVEKLRGELTLVKADREAVERLLLSARVMAEELADKYKVSGLDAIDREQLAKELNLLKDKIDADGEDDVINGIINGVLLAAKPQREVRMSSDAAHHGVAMIAKMLATREEERLVWTSETIKRRMYDARAWSRRHCNKKPDEKSGGSEEEMSITKFLSLWKVPNDDHYGGECTDVQQSLVVMREFPWFKTDYIDRKNTLKSVAVEANKQLRGGFSWHTEPEFEGKRALRKGSQGSDQWKLYSKIQHMVGGSGKLTDVETMLQGLPEARAAWYRDQWTSKEKEHKAYTSRRKREREEAKEDRAL